MNSSIKLNTPCEPINLTPLNPLISKCQIKVCYVDDKPNRNGSIITKDVAKKIANSIPGSPIVGYYNRDKKDFEEHNKIIDISNGEFNIIESTRPYGFVDLGAKVWFQKFDEYGTVRDYLMTEGYLWTGQYPEAKRVIDKGNNQSMELDPKTIDGFWTENNNGELQYFIINEAVMSKLCILGEDVEPCFEGAQISAIQYSLDDNFKQQLFSLINQMKEILDEGGTPVFEEKETLVPAEEISEEELVTPIEEVEVIEETKEEELVEEAEDSAPEEEIEKEEDKPAQYNLDEIQEYIELKAQYSELEAKYNDLVIETENLKNDNLALNEFKKTVERKDKEAMINSFYMLSDDDKKDVLTNIDTYSLDDIEAKLSIICVRNKVSFNMENETKETPTTYSLSSENSLDDSVPAWIKLAASVEKELKA